MRDPKVFEYLEIVFGTIAPPLDIFIYGSHESYEFIRDNPVKISILNFLIVLILLWIEVLESIPA